MFHVKQKKPPLSKGGGPPKPKKRCHPERLKKIADFRRESKDLRTDLTANVPVVRRSVDSLRSLRMTDFGCAAKMAFFNVPVISFVSRETIYLPPPPKSMMEV